MFASVGEHREPSPFPPGAANLRSVPGVRADWAPDGQRAGKISARFGPHPNPLREGEGTTNLPFAKVQMQFGWGP